ncbi:glutathione S-transferase kappa 1 [Polychaeton citri CBS 116435]|uniref:Glutathione S-transferase kappa n=1 Tax=Polychaeton citri CBS 116435 TaxID=1314669 RepID=A0A9P4UM67_9PEZI|nr:glutathione S-transferase kappa 1 [Polychaeton citri CBS 116435]
MTAAKIDVWLDCNSFYSRFALLHLRKYAGQLLQHGVDYEVHPVYINGINQGSGNQPPWMLPAKAKYSKFDGKRATNYFGTKSMQPPKGFPLKTLMALRSMCYVKETYPKERYELAISELWTAIWEDGIDVGKPELLASVLRRHFAESDVAEILQAAQEPRFKERLTSNTEEALKTGAFGAPWFMVKNFKGETEPFFGSDRFHYMWDYLEIPHRDFKVLAIGESKL